MTTTTTTRATPRDLHQALADAFNRRNLDEILGLYAEGATLAPQPGQSVTGKKEIAQALQGFLAVPGTMRIDTVYTLEAGPLALTRSLWSIREGSETRIEARGTEVMVRGADGNWRFAVDHPFGADDKSW